MTNTEIKSYVSLESLAATFHLPKAYLKELALKGLIPCLDVNGRCRFDVASVQKALVELAVTTKLQRAKELYALTGAPVPFSSTKEGCQCLTAS